MRVKRRVQRAFTLIELLVVVAIIALLISILLPALARAREQTREVLCRSHLRQLATGFHTYATEFNGCLPGTDRDNILIGGAVAKGFCWLGTGPDTWNSYQDAIKYVPFRGTVYKG